MGQGPERHAGLPRTSRRRPRRSCRTAGTTPATSSRMDEDGFITITDRLSRFSKIGGEMVPHVTVEEILHELAGLTEQSFAVTGVPDEKKGRAPRGPAHARRTRLSTRSSKKLADAGDPEPLETEATSSQGRRAPVPRHRQARSEGDQGGGCGTIGPMRRKPESEFAGYCIQTMRRRRVPSGSLAIE